MTNYAPSFSPQEFELRGYTNPYMTAEQKTAVVQTEQRVEGQLNWIAQSLGWSGFNYWDNLPDTVDQKRQLLGGTYGVYNGFYIPRVLEVRNWQNAVVIKKDTLVQPGQIVFMDEGQGLFSEYKIASITEEGNTYVLNFDFLPDTFYEDIQNNIPFRIKIPEARPAPFTRPTIGVAGDCSFLCKVEGTELSLYPYYDYGRKFQYKSPILMSGSTYYFNEFIYLTRDPGLAPEIASTYSEERELWQLVIPANLDIAQVGITATLVSPYSDPTASVLATMEIVLQPWKDPSDWNSNNVLRYFTGVWGNKGGPLPFNFSFDSLSLHGFDERNSLLFTSFSNSLYFNDVVNLVYYQKVPIQPFGPGNSNTGDIWWNNQTGALSVRVTNAEKCGPWVEIDYRKQSLLEENQVVYFTYPDVATFQANESSITLDCLVRILDITGLSPNDGIIGLQNTLVSPGSMLLYRSSVNSYWTPTLFQYRTVADFDNDALALPYEVPVLLTNTTGLPPSTANFFIQNLQITLTQDYNVVITKRNINTTWVISPDSILKYIADTDLVGGPLQGQMWWDFAQTVEEARFAAIFDLEDWVAVNRDSQSGPPAPVLNPNVLLFYCNETLLVDGDSYYTDDFIFGYTWDPGTGTFFFDYKPLTPNGILYFPKIEVSDNLTTVYRVDITDTVFSGVEFYATPNVYDCETPLRLWKSQDLQVVETVQHLLEDNYINPLRADINYGPGNNNWERYFVRLPLDYERNGDQWQKVALICQNFAYWGSPTDPEEMRCPPEESVPEIYEQLCMYPSSVRDYTYVYSEPYWYSNIGYQDSSEIGDFQNAGVFPEFNTDYDNVIEGKLIPYEPLHNRQTDTESPVNGGYGDWLGTYVNVSPCNSLTGFLGNDLESGAVSPVAPPVWDASIYKFPPTCAHKPETYNVDANHYRIGYCYFVADASAAEEGFFDPQQEASWRFPVNQPRTFYMTPR